MKEERRAATTDEVLAWTNSVRAQVDLSPIDRLLPGVPGDHLKCSLARSLSGCGWYASVGPPLDVKYFRLRGPYMSLHVPMPLAVGEWVYRADNGEFPEIIEATE